MTSEPPLTGTSRADVALAQALVVLTPLVRWLLRSGVNYGGLADALKAVFLHEAAAELIRNGAKTTDSALSVLSGLHRKDVRALRDSPPAQGIFAATPASILFTRWLTHTDYRITNGAAMDRLARTGPAPSFESLARDVSSDVHPRTLLEELVRLGLVTVEGDDVVLAAGSFAPDPSNRGVQELVAANVADHLAAAVHNMTGAEPTRFLEQSVFARGLSEASSEQLAQLARALWQPAFQAMVAEATRLVEADDATGNAPMRVRFGVYYYHERSADSVGTAGHASQDAGKGTRKRVARRRPRA